MIDRSEAEESATRRAVLVGASVALFGVACAPRPDGLGAATPQAASDPEFLRLSQTLTGHADLDPVTAGRLSAAFAQVAPDQHAHFKQLEALTKPGMAPADALAAATAVGLGPTVLAIVAAWYTGTAGSGTRAITVAYRDALMQRPVADALDPPTYAMGGPGWWVAAPPDVGLPRSAPAAEARR